MARKCKSNEVRIEDGKLFIEDAFQCRLDDPIAAEMLEDKYITSVRLVSLETNWVANVALYQAGNWVEIEQIINLEMTLRKEKRSGKFHWYAYRRKGGKLYKRYVGYSENMTAARLVEIAAKMP